MAILRNFRGKLDRPDGGTTNLAGPIGTHGWRPAGGAVPAIRHARQAHHGSCRCDRGHGPAQRPHALPRRLVRRLRQCCFPGHWRINRTRRPHGAFGRFHRWRRNQASGPVPHLARTLLGCGVAASVAASFNAPIAGVFFALEVIIGHYALSAFAPVVIASVAGTVICRAHLGSQPAFLLPQFGVHSLWEFPAFMVLGAVCAGIAIVFMWSIFLCRTGN